MESGNFSLYSLLIVTLLAVIVPLLVSRIRAVRVPIVVGEILIGVVVGKSGFNVIQQSQWLDFLQFFGLSYLMFVSGLEIDFSALKPHPNSNVRGWQRWVFSTPSFAVLSSALTFGLAYVFSLWLNHHHFIKSPLLFALIITTTSLTVVVPVLKEYGMLSEDFGQLLLAAAMFADFFTMMLISVAASLFQGGFSASVLLVLVLIVLIVALYFIFRHFSGIYSFRNLAHGTAQLGIRASLALMIVFIVLSQTMGVQVILGTFLAGILVGLINPRERTDVFHKLDAIGFGFLIPIFFIMIGVTFDAGALLRDRQALILLPLLFVATYLFKGLPALLLRTRYSWRHTMSGAFLLTTQMSVTVAAAAVGVRIGAISPGVNSAIVLVAMLTAVISPVVFGKVIPKAQEKPEKQPMVIGSTADARLLVEQIRQRGESVEWFEQLPRKDRDNGLPVEDIQVGEVSAAVVATSDDDINLQTAEALVNMGVANVICRIQSVDTFQTVHHQVPFHVVHPQWSTISLIDQMIRQPLSTELLTTPSGLRIEEIVLWNRVFQGRQIRDVRFPGTLLVLSIVRDGSQIIPHGETILSIGDTLVVIGQPDDIATFRGQAKGKF